MEIPFPIGSVTDVATNCFPQKKKKVFFFSREIPDYYYLFLFYANENTLDKEILSSKKVTFPITLCFLFFFVNSVLLRANLYY